MANPFEKRATEYLRDDAAFLSVVTPEPLHTFFERHAKDGTLYDRLCTVIGTPGSGKTTIATLLQYKTVETLRNSPNIAEYKALIHALTKCGIVKDNKTQILGCRLPLESEYREFWELPYKDEIKLGLLKSFLQSRAIIAWMKNLQENRRYDLANVKIIYRDQADVAADSIGGQNALDVFEKAKSVERAIYEISAALIAPKESSLKDDAIAPYHPFDAIDHFVVNYGANPAQVLKPLVMLDDAHTLHRSQLIAVGSWLARREMKIGRWLLMRLDAQTPETVLTEGFGKDSGIVSESEIKKSREITYIWLQSSIDRRKQREDFRKMARSMADKYLRLMPVFTRQGISRFSDILNTGVSEISESKYIELSRKIDRTQKNLGISNLRRKTFESEIDNYFNNSETTDKGRDVKLALLSIIMHRYANRVPQESLFQLEPVDPEPNKPIKIKAGLADGARVYLMHNYNRPYYFGVDAICDGSSDNAELFLQLSGRLVEAAETRIIKSPNGSAALPPAYQHKLLVERAQEMMDEWSFPLYGEVKSLCKTIAKHCVEKSLEPNAPLDGGANAYGILQDEFDTIPEKFPELAKVIKFAVAYNAISLKPKYSTKHKEWCLVELTGPVLMVSGLTMNRGGFLEKTVADLLDAIERKQL
ncbi:hypothetical protein KI811_16240 [Geobacter hydrogenophilus]|uniref:Uncharacterized protein n=1 Tax=Geobacter hydrogenophilus TaxID=40983 RepID=A0A9W6LE25_9BACT|nr:hypothetical protein [Geobacter hydrogenophilus]MBT0895358.1 hypothetical protein [Geobacter hydrogenophilus]GLI39585.1 hypothetical protein GHYDROH2_30860 [Geobacter hydrogenophilus]